MRARLVWVEVEGKVDVARFEGISWIRALGLVVVKGFVSRGG